MTLGYSTVRVNVTALVIDGVDSDDLPDVTPLSGRIILSPMIQTGRTIQYDEGGELKLKALTEMEVDIGATGDIEHRNRDYVKVVAPSAATTNMAELQWKATFKDLKYGTKSTSIDPIYFYAVPDAVINLADHVNVAPNSTAIQLSRGPRGFGVGEVIDENGELVFLLDDAGATEVGRVAMPEGVVSDEAIAEKVLAPDSATKAALDGTYAPVGAAVNPEDVGYDIVIVAGQSNASGRGLGFDTTRFEAQHPRIFQFATSGTYAGQISVAVPVLGQHDTPTGIGPAMHFGLQHIRTLPENRSILFVPVAHGGTGFHQNPDDLLTWDHALGVAADKDLALNAVVQTQAALAAAGPNSRIVAMLWHQGENDGGYSMPTSEYAGHFDYFANYVRTSLGLPDLPIILGQIAPENIASGASKAAINAAHVDTPRRLLNTAFVYAPAGALNAGDPTTHFSAVGQRILGARYATDGIRLARANVFGVAPVPPRSMAITQSGTTMTVVLDRGSCRYTDFVWQYRVVGAGSWTTWAHAASLDAKAAITGLTLGASYEVRAATVNEQGTSAFTPAATFTLVSAPAQVTGLTAGTATAFEQPLSWSASARAASYLVEYKTHASSTWLTFETATALASTVAGLAYSTQYDYRVTAYNAAGAGASSDVLTATTGALTIGFTDNFNRADAATLGASYVASSQAGTPVWSIVSNRASLTAATSGNNVISRECNSADGTLQVTIAAGGATKQMGLAARVQDALNNLRVAPLSTGDLRYTLFKRVASTSTVVQTATTKTVADGDVMQVVLAGTSVIVKVNGTTIITATVSEFTGVTKHGLFCSSGTLDGAFEDLSFAA